MKLLLTVAILFFSTATFAQWRMRPQVGIGFTNNANYETENKDADLFWWARSSNTKINDHSSWNLWLSYKDFMKEHQNDVLGYRFGQTKELRSRGIGAVDWDWALGGQQYVQGSPATSEESFDHVYGETSAMKTLTPRNNLEVTLESLYQLKFFQKFEGRVDHSLLFNSELAWSLSPIQALTPYLELGLTFSSQSLYSKNYFELGSEWRIFPQPDLTYVVQLVSRFSSFPHRQVSETTMISNNKKNPQVTTQTETESQSFFQIQTSVAKMIERTELRGSLALNSQSSKSGIENYQEIQAYISVLVPL